MQYVEVTNCRFKLSKKEQADVKAALEDISFTCGTQLQGLELPGHLNEVYTRTMSCEEPIEKLYYVAKYAGDYMCVLCSLYVCTVQLMLTLSPSKSTHNAQIVLTSQQSLNNC